MCPKDSASLSAKVAQLRDALHDVMEDEEKLTSDLYLYHWLRANNYDVKKANRTIRENLKWRQEEGVKELAQSEVDPQIQSRYAYFHAEGAGGIPVAFYSGATDIVDILNEFGKKRLLHHVVQVLTKQENLVYEFDKTWNGSVEDLPAERSSGCHSIYDMEGYSMKQASSLKALQFCVEFAKMVTKYFPAAGHVVTIMNANKLIEIPLQICKPIVSGRSDLDIHGKDEEDVAVVADVLKPEQLRDLQARAKEILGRN